MRRITERSARVGVIGLGYVGLPLAVTAARAGYPVTGFDVDADKMVLLAAGTSYIEAVSAEDLAAVAGRFDWTTDFDRLSDCAVIVICVPTPLTAHRTPDLGYVERTARQIAQRLQPQTLVILESTTFPGTTRDILGPILAESGLGLGVDVFTAFSPEREDPGNSQYRTKTIPKIVAGDGPEAGALVEAFYANVVDRVVRVSSTATAEAVKITENIFRSVNIALVNELKLIFERMDIDIWEVVDAAATKPFGYMPFYPGPGLGGHCIPIDPFYLTWRARELGLSTRFIELAGEINTAMPEHVVGRLREVLDRTVGRGLNGARILLAGIAYKKNVSDMRESPAMRLLALLDQAGAEVAYLDPLVPEIPVTRDYARYAGRRSLGPQDVAEQPFDAILIATDHDAMDYALFARKGCPVLDSRNAMARRNLPMTHVTKV